MRASWHITRALCNRCGQPGVHGGDGTLCVEALEAALKAEKRQPPEPSWIFDRFTLKQARIFRAIYQDCRGKKDVCKSFGITSRAFDSTMYRIRRHLRTAV